YGDAASTPRVACGAAALGVSRGRAHLECPEKGKKGPRLMSSGECVAENVIARKQQMAVLVPGYNEESAVAKVVADFRSALPTAAVYVYDNNSTDKTAEVVRAAGAVVRRETYQGKGYVVRRMFNDVEAERPLSLFGAFGIALAIVAIGFAIPIFITC